MQPTGASPVLGSGAPLTVLSRRGALKGSEEREKNHRIMEWFGLEGTLKSTWFQPPCHEQGHLPAQAQSLLKEGNLKMKGQPFQRS